MIERGDWRGRLVVGMCGVLALTSACDDKSSKPTEAAKPKAAAAPSLTAPAKKPERAYPTAPKSLGAIKVPADNPMSAAKVELGRKLFFDKRLSVDGSRACYSCHLNENGTGGGVPLAVGAGEKPLTRHSPSLWNVAYLGALYWDGRADGLEAQAMGAWKGGNMGVPADQLTKKADEIGSLPDYKDAFIEAFPTQGATPKTITQAIAAYERTLFCGDTAYDRFSAGDTNAMTAEQKTGWQIFAGKGNCHACHTPPFFTDSVMVPTGSYHNAGVGFEGKKPEDVDPGRGKVTGSKSEFAAFKTPSLRNITKTAPYFHDGSVAKLDDAVRFMAGGGYKNENLDSKFVDRKLTDEEVKAVVAFLGALDCAETLDVAATYQATPEAASASATASAPSAAPTTTAPVPTGRPAKAAP